MIKKSGYGVYSCAVVSIHNYHGMDGKDRGEEGVPHDHQR